MTRYATEVRNVFAADLSAVFGVDQLAEWLETTVDRVTGDCLSRRFAVDICTRARQYRDAYEIGSLGFEASLNSAFFPTAALPRLRLALEHGLVDDLIVVAYPTKERIRSVHLAPQTRFVDFQISHLRSRGYLIGNDCRRLLDMSSWEECVSPASSAKYGVKDSPPIAGLPSSPKSYASEISTRGVPRSLDDVAGVVRIVFTLSLSHDSSRLIKGTFDEIIEKAVRLLTPSEYLAGMQLIPRNAAQYPSSAHAEWLGATTRNLGIYARSTGDGLHFRASWRDDLRLVRRYRASV